MGEEEFYKKRPGDKMWWVRKIVVDKDGDLLPIPGYFKFSFDRKTIFEFSDYPQNLSTEQKEIFDKENPYWAEFLKNRM